VLPNILWPEQTILMCKAGRKLVRYDPAELWGQGRKWSREQALAPQEVLGPLVCVQPRFRAGETLLTCAAKVEDLCAVFGRIEGGGSGREQASVPGERSWKWHRRPEVVAKWHRCPEALGLGPSAADVTCWS